MQRFTIFGRESCGFCRQAKALCEQKGLPYRYVDIVDENISQADLEKTIGQAVSTVPQIFHGQDYIGGYSALVKYIDQSLVTA